MLTRRTMNRQTRKLRTQGVLPGPTSNGPNVLAECEKTIDRLSCDDIAALGYARNKICSGVTFDVANEINKKEIITGT